ncbi:hypothetical protein BC834DRAFT_888846 [Gloeopeniophorella convolvens]|nr:hypothetical protein BC834DRAFT_888846 [Gloeopeniophorella convolvens]
MPPALLSAALLSRILPRKDLQGDAPDPERNLQEAEKGSSSSPGEDPDQTLNEEGLEDHDRDDLDAFDEPDGTGADEDEPHPRQRSRRASSVDTSSSSIATFVRPSLPDWLVKTKELLFGSPHDDEDFIPNYRKTPILSGSLIPFAILLEIPGLTEHWYVRTDGNTILQIRKNPTILDAALAFSMASAVLANVALIFRFLERRVKGCTLVAIIALTLHDLVNIVTVITFGVEHRFNDGFTYGEAYWMTVCSTIVSIFTNVTLIYDLYTTPNFSKSGSGITRKQRSLVIITIIFLTYVALGALISSLMMSLTFLNGLFFTIATTLTIGFGDIVPVTAAQRSVVCLYSAFGIVILGAAVRLISEAVIEGLEIGYRQRVRAFRRRRDERKHEHEQTQRWRAVIERRLTERGLDTWTPDDTALPPVRPTLRRGGSNFAAQAMHLNTEALPPESLKEAAQEAGVSLDKFVGRKFGRRIRQHHHPHHPHQQDQLDSQSESQQQKGPAQGRGSVPLENAWTIDDGAAQMQDAPPKTHRWNAAWWARTYGVLRKAKEGEVVPDGKEDRCGEGLAAAYTDTLQALEKDERRSLYIKLGLAWTLFFTFWTIGSLIFSQTENWAYGTAMYFCFITFTTIGYGDVAPQTALGRSIFIFWALLGVGAMTILIAVISDAFSSKYRSVTHSKTFDRAVRKYRQGRRKPHRDNVKNSASRSGRSPAQLAPALRANLARLSSPEAAAPARASLPAQTLTEAESRLRSRMEPLPAMILEEVLKLREHTRYFLVANGHADGLSSYADRRGKDGITLPPENVVPEELKKLLDEIAQEEGFGERLKQEVWDDDYARNTLFVLSLERGIRKMIDAAELALETLAERDQLLATEEREVQRETSGEQAGEAEERASSYEERASVAESAKSKLSGMK